VLIASRFLFLLGVLCSDLGLLVFSLLCDALRWSLCSIVRDTRESISCFSSVSPPLCCFCRLRFFYCRPDLRFLKATSQFSWFVSSAPERAKVSIRIFVLCRFSVWAELPLAQTGACTQFLSAKNYIFGSASAFPFLV
jgi:hypothetical protein